MDVVLKGAMYGCYSSVLLVLSNPHVRDKKGINTARDSDRPVMAVILKQDG